MLVFSLRDSEPSQLRGSARRNKRCRRVRSTHASADFPFATLVTLTDRADPRTCSATAIAHAFGAGCLTPLHVLSPAHGRPEVRVQSSRVQRFSAPVALGLTKRILEAASITLRTSGHRLAEKSSR